MVLDEGCRQKFVYTKKCRQPKSPISRLDPKMKNPPALESSCGGQASRLALVAWAGCWLTRFGRWWFIRGRGTLRRATRDIGEPDADDALARRGLR